MNDEDIRAAEYVIGTLSHDERQAFERDLAGQARLQRLVIGWQKKMSPLDVAIPDVAAPAGVWTAVEESILQQERADRELRDLRVSRNWWRRGAFAFAGIAATLIVFIVARTFAVAPAGSFIAVIDRGGSLPALIVRVDTAARTLSLQPVAMEFPEGKSLELWFVEGGGAPKSLGVMRDGRSSLILPAVARDGDLSGSLLAVSVEPRGGSRTGAPTGPVIYSGKLIPE